MYGPHRFFLSQYMALARSAKVELVNASEVEQPPDDHQAAQPKVVAVMGWGVSPAVVKKSGELHQTQHSSIGHWT